MPLRKQTIFYAFNRKFVRNVNASNNKHIINFVQLKCCSPNLSHRIWNLAQFFKLVGNYSIPFSLIIIWEMKIRIIILRLLAFCACQTKYARNMANNKNENKKEEEKEVDEMNVSRNWIALTNAMALNRISGNANNRCSIVTFAHFLPTCNFVRNARR